jgi:hypothetical protein
MGIPKDTPGKIAISKQNLIFVYLRPKTLYEYRSKEHHRFERPCCIQVHIDNERVKEDIKTCRSLYVIG